MPQTQLVDLNLKSLAEMDGRRIDAMLRHHSQRVSYDCQSRPGDATARKIVIEFHFKPIEDPETRECAEVRMEIKGKSTVPPHITKPYQLMPTGGGFKFNLDFPEDLDQPSLYPKSEDDAE